jgi:hypothetical protein
VAVAVAVAAVTKVVQQHLESVVLEVLAVAVSVKMVLIHRPLAEQLVEEKEVTSQVFKVHQEQLESDVVVSWVSQVEQLQQELEPMVVEVKHVVVVLQTRSLAVAVAVAVKLAAAAAAADLLGLLVVQVTQKVLVLAVAADRLILVALQAELLITEFG